MPIRCFVLFLFVASVVTFENSFGYWAPRDISFSWVDLSSSTYFEPTVTTDTCTNKTLPFSFPFYNGTYSQIQLSDKGAIQVGPEEVGVSCGDAYSRLTCPLPTAIDDGMYNRLIAAFGQDLGPVTFGGQVHYGEFSNCPHTQFSNLRCVVTEFILVNAYGYSGSNPNYESGIFEMIIVENGVILFQYLAEPGAFFDGNTIVSGIQDAYLGQGIMNSMNHSICPVGGDIRNSSMYAYAPPCQSPFVAGVAGSCDMTCYGSSIEFDFNEGYSCVPCASYEFSSTPLNCTECVDGTVEFNSSTSPSHCVISGGGGGSTSSASLLDILF